jgi:hypothetical protein
MRVLYLWIFEVMTETPGSTEREYVCLSVGADLRDLLRVKTAKSGQSYEEYLRENLSLEAES